MTNRQVQNISKLLLKKHKAGSDYKAGPEYKETVTKKLRLGLTIRQVQKMRKLLLKQNGSD